MTNRLCLTKKSLAAGHIANFQTAPKKYLKAGGMENGLAIEIREGSPQGGPLLPLLVNIYLNEYDQEMARRGGPVVRYADD